MGNDESKRRRRNRQRAANEGARALRLQELIREEVNLLLRGEIRDGRLDGVSITQVELNGDCARLWFSGPVESEVGEALAGAAGFLRSRLTESLGLKRTPDLRFRRDPATRKLDTNEEDLD